MKGPALHPPPPPAPCERRGKSGLTWIKAVRIDHVVFQCIPEASVNEGEYAPVLWVQLLPLSVSQLG